MEGKRGEKQGMGGRGGGSNRRGLAATRRAWETGEGQQVEGAHGCTCAGRHVGRHSCVHASNLLLKQPRIFFLNSPPSPMPLLPTTFQL